MVSQAQIDAHRRDVAELTRLAALDLRVLFDRARDAERVRDTLAEVLPVVVSVYGEAAGTLGADWYDELREQAAVGGRFRAFPAAPPDRGRTDVLARWATGPLFSADPDPALAFSNAAGGVQRIIADVDRETVTGSVRRDDAAKGWRREGTGECDWCRSRLGVLTTDPHEAFATHDRCGCAAVPEF